MKIAVTPDGTVSIESNIVSLRGARPVLNAVILENLQVEIAPTVPAAQNILVRYRSPALGPGAFIIEAQWESRKECGWLRYWLEDLDPQLELNSFGLPFAALENFAGHLRKA